MTADLPVGTMLPTVRGDWPDDWLPCDGRELSRQEYEDLFAEIGTAYGPGDGRTTFNVPNLSGQDTVWTAFIVRVRPPEPIVQPREAPEDRED